MENEEGFTRFEKTRLISARALQLSLGAPPLVKVDEFQSVLEIARTEFSEKVIPLAVLRRFPDGTTRKILLSM